MSEEKRKPQSQSFGCFCTLAYFSVISLSLSLMASTSFLLIAYTWALSVAIRTVFMAVLQPHVPMHFYAGQLPLFSSYNSLGFNIHIASPQQGQMNNYIWINPLNPKFFSFQTTFSPHMPFRHLISISVQALTPKLNPCLLLTLISSLVTLTTPTH